MYLMKSKIHHVHCLSQDPINHRHCSADCQGYPDFSDAPDQLKISVLVLVGTSWKSRFNNIIWFDLMEGGVMSDRVGFT